MGVCRPRRGRDQPALRAHRTSPGQYAWYLGNSKELKPGPSGACSPTTWACLQIWNLYEWCQEPDDKTSQDHGSLSEHINDNTRLLRGGAFLDYPAYVRSAYRFRFAPSGRDADSGFRPSRTYP